jgi:hypothetical protein
MNIQMNELHDINIHDITSLFNNEFHMERTSVCLDIVNEIHVLFLWHSIGSRLVPKCVHSHHTHANEQNIRVDDSKSLNLKCPLFHIFIDIQL